MEHNGPATIDVFNQDDNRHKDCQRRDRKHYVSKKRSSLLSLLRLFMAMAVNGEHSKDNVKTNGSCSHSCDNVSSTNCESNTNTSTTSASSSSSSLSKKESTTSSSTRKSSKSSTSNGFQSTVLELFALKSLELTAPASDVILKNYASQWVQLSGHENCFAIAGPGIVWKKRADGDNELRVYQALSKDKTMNNVVPKFYRDVEYKGDKYIEMQDLLYEFKDAAIMDIKVGTRTFLESEVSNSKERSDLYEKMIKIDPNAPTSQEHELKAVTKLRYMQFRENLSSSSNLGFRIEGFKAGHENAHAVKDLKNLKTKEDVKSTLWPFLLENESVANKLVEKLKQLQSKFSNSSFFKNHEVIGSSLLIIHNAKEVGVWMIDFAKTIPLPEGTQVDHKSNWSLGNHEDGYLFGLNNLIQLIEECSKDSYHQTKNNE